MNKIDDFIRAVMDYEHNHGLGCSYSKHLLSASELLDALQGDHKVTRRCTRSRFCKLLKFANDVAERMSITFDPSVVSFAADLSAPPQKQQVKHTTERAFAMGRG